MFGLFEPFSEQGLVHHWTLNETTGTGAVVKDRRGGLTGTTVNTENGDWAVGKIGNSINLDGSDEHISVAGAGAVFPTGDFTWAIWNFSITNLNNTLISISDGSGNRELNMDIDFTKFDVTVNGTLLAGTTTVSNFNFRHYAVTRIGSAVTTYIDGTSETTGTVSGALGFSTCALLMGVRANASCTGTLSNFMEGRLDDVRIYDRGLSSSEIAGLAGLGV